MILTMDMSTVVDFVGNWRWIRDSLYTADSSGYYLGKGDGSESNQEGEKDKNEIQSDKKALGQYRDYNFNYFLQSKNHDWLYQIVVWTDIFLSCNNTYNIYHSDTIISLSDTFWEKEEGS